MVVLLTCKNKEDPIKNEGARVFTTLYIDFSDAQGQITLESVLVSGPHWNSSKLSCMSSLPERMRMIESKTSPKGNNPHLTTNHQNTLNSCQVKDLKIFLIGQGQLTPQSMVGSGQISTSFETI